MTDQYNGEQVLVIPTLLLHETGYFQGFDERGESRLESLIDPAHTLFLPRTAAEDDPSYKQLIPYCLFEHAGRLLHYRRGGGGGEGRLHGKRSVGVGGHISTEDAAGGSHPYHSGLERELAEEIEIGSGFQQQIVGLINDDATEVGRVHLGVVHLFHLEEPRVTSRETAIGDVGFASANELTELLDEFETWSQICIRWWAERTNRA